MEAYEKSEKVRRSIRSRTGLDVGHDDAATLRRCELTLQRWGEGECGDENGNCIERDEETGKPYRAHYGTTKTRYSIPDREAGALRRVAAICKRHMLHYFHQTDPRGCALYVSHEPLTDSDYAGKGVACCE